MWIKQIRKLWGIRMKIEANCPKCLKIKIAEKDILDCFICPFCNSIIAKLHK